MPFTFNYEASDAERLLMEDSYTKLCTVPFPLEAANASRIMHYQTPARVPSLIFLCNAGIHMRRVTPSNALRIAGVPTKKYAVIPCNNYGEQEVLETVAKLNEAGYYAYTAVVNGTVKLYVSWDERCKDAAKIAAASHDEVEES